MPQPPNLDLLLERAGSGDRQALADLLAAIGPQVRARLVGRIAPGYRSVLEEDDVMQVTYLEAVLDIEKFVGGGVAGFVAWLTRMAEHNLLDATRALSSAKRPDPRRKVGPPPSYQDSVIGLMDMLGATSQTPSRDAARLEAGAWLERALKQLPPDYERVIRLYDLAGKDPAIVAAEMGRSQGAVFMLRARAHDRLKQILGSASKFFSTPE